MLVTTEVTFKMIIPIVDPFSRIHDDFWLLFVVFINYILPLYQFD